MDTTGDDEKPFDIESFRLTEGDRRKWGEWFATLPEAKKQAIRDRDEFDAWCEALQNVPGCGRA